MKALFLGVFFVSVVIHLYASLRRDTRMRNSSKPVILLSLLGFYILAARSVSVLIILALLFSWAGDILLIPGGMKWFTAGGISFILSHVFYIAGYWKDVDFSRIPYFLTVLPALFFTAVVSFLFSKLKQHLPKSLLFPVLLYLLLNAAMNCFALFRCISTASAAAFTTAVGAALFFVSDSFLFFVRFNRNSRLKTHFVVMLTYSIGELLIILGLL